MAQQGYVSATIGYRLAPKHKFPAQVNDVKCAIRFLRAHADEYGIDPNRIGACGFSAGAHLAMMLGVVQKKDNLEGDGGNPDQSSAVQAVVSYFGPTDLTAEDIRRSMDRYWLDSSAARWKKSGMRMRTRRRSIM